MPSHDDTPSQPRAPGDDLVGTTLGPYRVDARLGEGGMGVVYRARDARLGRDVALKVLPAAYVSDGDRRARLLREARSAAAVSDANLAAVYDVGESDGRLYLAMELVEGATLRARLQGGALKERSAVRIARAIAAGLAKAHERGIVHRDLKPENVMLSRHGNVKILDFGLAKVRQEAENLEGRVVGTRGYMSPEQAAGRPVDARTDVYALGVMLHEMLTGALPAHGTIADAGLAAVVARCTARSADERWADARQVLDALGQWRTSRRARRARARTWAAVGSALLVLGAAAAALAHCVTR